MEETCEHANGEHPSLSYTRLLECTSNDYCPSRASYGGVSICQRYKKKEEVA